MPAQKKHGKGRLDKWYKLAKEKGYRARAAFKLIQLNKKYGFLEKSKVVLDLCAAPGSWCQVAAQTTPANSLIVGVDLAEIKPIPRVITFQSDITTDSCRATIRQHFKTWKADTVLHDGAPNVGTAWIQDAFDQNVLVLHSLKLATEFLAEGGTFVTKVFRSRDYNSLLWVFNQLFTKVEATKPPSSRNVSAEIFVVCRGFKAPKWIDPKFLDARSVFAELLEPTPNLEAKVFKPELKKRKRDGYEEGNYTQFKEAPASEFVQTTDPIVMLGTLNKLSFEQTGVGDIALAALNKLPETTAEIRACCADLRVLGKKEFRNLLRWRLKAREIFGLAVKNAELNGVNSEEVAEIAPMDEELMLQEELHRLNEQESSRKKKERRKENERKQKEIIRLQLHMTAPLDIGLEQGGGQGDAEMFALKTIDNAGGTKRLTNGRMVAVQEATNERDSGSKDEQISDLEGNDLENELDSLYEQYQERKSESDAKFRAKKARKEHEDGEWQGISDKRDSSGETASEDDDEPDDFSEADEEKASGPLLTSLESSKHVKNGLTNRASRFFDQDIFKDIAELSATILADDNGQKLEDRRKAQKVDFKVFANDLVENEGQTLHVESKLIDENTSDSERSFTDGGQSSERMDDEFEIVKEKRSSRAMGQWEDELEPEKNGRLDIEIITAEAMTLAQQLASGETSRYDLTDDGFNKYAFRDRDGLPEWFLDDEGKHSKPLKPISATGAAAIKEKLRALNARPIKKVKEAKDRKKFKAAQKLEKLRKKSALLAEDEGMTEKEKAQGIARLMSRATKTKPKQRAKLVVARGGNRGISGRPKGVKGRYKIVDARLKKDVRALKRLSKK